ncbi:hypothetical protein EJD97_002846 [Solanum chilense]|uniref:Uncharacterized protein n=1 Tax=Solanum chilense TaxID=4083 RepID=A0A6N2BV22_SOLCI|nr:hypothetical protein EJD97_002846 [Solanum chilense]
MARKGVIISVYVESSSTIDPHKFDELKRSQANEFLWSSKGTTRTKGYDRHAQLLAYAHELRHDNTKQKHKKKRWIRRIGSSFPHLFRRKNKEHRYERMETEEKENKSTSNFCKKLKCFLKDISYSIWQFGNK